MCTEKIPSNELELARNYMMGSFIRNSDGPLAMADRFKSVHFSGLGYSYYDYYLGCINKSTSDDLLKMAKTYFDLSKAVEIVAGKI
jgi:predicted Zn-dependent peptidase